MRNPRFSATAGWFCAMLLAIASIEPIPYGSILFWVVLLIIGGSGFNAVRELGYLISGE